MCRALVYELELQLIRKPAFSLALALLFVALLGAFLFSLFITFFAAEILDEPRATVAVSPRLTERVLLIVIDGLRADTLYSSGCMPRLAALAHEHTSGIALATPITMTGVGIKALGGGVSSGLWSIARNWDQPPATFDNLFASLRQRGGKLTFIGNPTWTKLYGPASDGVTEADLRRRRMTDLFHLLDPVYGDDLVWTRVAKQFVGDPTKAWELTVVHLGGIDNASHIWTPLSPLFCDKATTMDRDIAAIVSAAGPTTTTLITSDHGTGDWGHHGSGEPEARRTPLVMVGPGIAAAPTFEVSQLDIAPTVATLLGLPIPAVVEGRPLTELLAITPEQRRRIDDQSVTQQQAYVDQYATVWRRHAPHFTAPGQLGPWLAADRSGSGVVPLLLSMAMAGVALWLFLRDQLRGDLPSLRATQTASIASVIVALEVLVAAWRIHNRAVSIAVARVLNSAGHAHTLVAWALAILVGLAATPVLRRVTSRSLLLGFAFMLGISALGDALALLVGVSLLVAMLGVRSSRRMQLIGATLLMLVEVAIFEARRLPLPPQTTLAAIAPLIIAVLLTLIVARGERLRPSLWLGVTAAIASALKLGVLPQRWIHPFLALPMLAALSFAVVSGNSRARRIVLGGIALIGLALLTEPAQALGFVALVAWLVFAAAMIARSSRRDDTDDDVWLDVFAIVGARLMFIHVFEGEFSFSRLEIHLGYLANPGQDHALGAATIIIKLFLPMFVSAALLLADRAPAARTRALVGATAFFALRIVHITLSMVVARGTFYSPYADAGQLLFHVLFVLSLMVLLATEPLNGRLTR